MAPPLNRVFFPCPPLINLNFFDRGWSPRFKVLLGQRTEDFVISRFDCRALVSLHKKLPRLFRQKIIVHLMICRKRNCLDKTRDPVKDFYVPNYLYSLK